MKTNTRLFLRIQGIYFIILGILPVLTQHNFLQSISLFGPQWLVRLSSGIMLSVGIAVLIQSYRKRIAGGALTLGILASLVLFVLDLMVEFSTPIMTTHVGDAFAQALFIGFGTQVFSRSEIFNRR